MWNKRVITSNGIHRVLSAGGKVQYRPFKAGKKINWELWAAYPDEEFIRVISAVTGEDRSFKSAHAVFSFHNRVFPSAGGLFVPVHENVTHSWSDEDRKLLSNMSETDTDEE